MTHTNPLQIRPFNFAKQQDTAEEKKQMNDTNKKWGHIWPRFDRNLQHAFASGWCSLQMPCEMRRPEWIWIIKCLIANDNRRTGERLCAFYSVSFVLHSTSYLYSSGFFFCCAMPFPQGASCFPPIIFRRSSMALALNVCAPANTTTCSSSTISTFIADFNCSSHSPDTKINHSFGSWHSLRYPT